MTLVKFKHSTPKSFNNLVDDFFNGFPSLFHDELVAPAVKQAVPVNIKETENAYELEVVVPGFNKEDFKVNVDKDLLTISAERKSEEESKNGKQLKREYKAQSFKRLFTLDEKIDAEKIEAKYVNGVLVVSLFKKEEVKAPVKQISIQ